MNPRALAFTVLGVLAACAWDKPDPAAFQPVPGNPCGNIGVECGHHMCCNEGETCGDGKTGCPLGMCCNIRTPPDFLRRADAGLGDAKSGDAERE